MQENHQEWANIMAGGGQKFIQELGQQIAHLRKEQGFTQVQLAGLLGVSQQLIAFYEGGYRRIPVTLLPELAGILGIPAGELLGQTNSRAKRGPTPKLQQQLEQVSRLPRTQQKFVSDMLTGLLQKTSR
jgi:transcriptional regulator with XRE-family HTH domain